MKKVILISLAILAVVASFSFRTEKKLVSEEVSITARDKVEVFYFHFTRRCVTCQSVEDEAKKAVEALYPDQVKKGSISFTGVNLDEETSKPLAERCKVTGQSLLVVSGDTRIDLTAEGFMYARTKPDKLKEELKKAIDPLLGSKK